MKFEPPARSPDGSTMESLASARIKEGPDGALVVLWTNGGGSLTLGPFTDRKTAGAVVAEVRSYIDRSLHSYHTIARNPDLRPPDEPLGSDNRAVIASEAAELARRVIEGELSRPLLAELEGLLCYPAMADRSRLAWFLEALHDEVADQRRREAPRRQG